MSLEPLAYVHLDEVIEQFTPKGTVAGRRAEILIKTDGLRVVLVTMLPGAALQEHSAPGPITIQAIRGEFAVTFGDEERALATGDIISLGPGQRHSVRAMTDGAFLLTIGGSPVGH